MLHRLIYDEKFVKELQMKMPKLSSKPKRQVPSEIYEEKDQSNLKLNNVTSVEVLGASIQCYKSWFIYSLPNLRHLILSGESLRDMDEKLSLILNERIQRLDTDMYGCLRLSTPASRCFSK